MRSTRRGVFEKRRHTGGGWRFALQDRLESLALGFGVFRFVQGVQARQRDVGVFIDELDTAQVPSGIAHHDFVEVTEPRRELEANTFHGEGSIASALLARSLHAETAPQLVARRRATKHVFVFQESLDGSATELRMKASVVLELDEGRHRPVQLLQCQLLDAFEHRHESSLDESPEDFLFSILVRRVRQDELVGDAEPAQTLLDLSGRFRSSVIGHQSSRNSSFLNPLRESVSEVLGGLGQIPLAMATKARAVIETPEKLRYLPLALAREHRERARVEVRVPKSSHVLDLVASNLEFVETLLRPLGSLSVACTHATLPKQTLRLHPSPYHFVRRQLS